MRKCAGQATPLEMTNILTSRTHRHSYHIHVQITTVDLERLFLNYLGKHMKRAQPLFS